MESLIMASRVVIPMAIMVGIGMLLRIVKLTDEPTMKKVDKLIFNVFMPMLSFYNIYKTDFSKLTTPLSFLSIGVTLKLGAVEKKKYLASGILLRLILVPALIIPLAALCGFRGQEMCALLILFAARQRSAAIPWQLPWMQTETSQHRWLPIPRFFACPPFSSGRCC